MPKLGDPRCGRRRTGSRRCPSRTRASTADAQRTGAARRRAAPPGRSSSGRRLGQQARRPTAPTNGRARPWQRRTPARRVPSAEDSRVIRRSPCVRKQAEEQNDADADAERVVADVAGLDLAQPRPPRRARARPTPLTAPSMTRASNSPAASKTCVAGTAHEGGDRARRSTSPSARTSGSTGSSLCCRYDAARRGRSPHDASEHGQRRPAAPRRWCRR